MHIAVYKGIDIVENYGQYSPAIDRTIESTSFEKIITWIDKTLGYQPIKWVVDRFIIGEYVIASKFQYN